MSPRSLGWCVGGLLGALFVYCGARTHSVSEPRAPGVSSVPLSLSAPAASAPAPAAAALAFEDFEPVLASPSLAAVRAALDGGSPAGAAHELQALLDKSPPAPALGFRYQLLLGRLCEQAADPAAALAAYRLAAEVDSLLRDYARVGAARMLYTLGKPREALAELQPVTELGPVALDKWAVQTQAAQAAGDRAGALEACRKRLSRRTRREHAEVALECAALLLSPGPEALRERDRLEALELARRAEAEQPSSRELSQKAGQVAAQALALLPEATRAAQREPSVDVTLERLRGLVDARLWSEAEALSGELLARLPAPPAPSAARCEAEFLRGKALFGRRQWSRASEVFEALCTRCASDADLKARAAYLSAKAAASNGEQMLAVQRFTRLERELADHSLADDARLQAALAYLELGVEARFTELLTRLPDDYPEGDMVVEGLFRLALRRIDKGDWAGAGRVLERAIGRLPAGEVGRGPDFAGRERYFHARALLATSDTERGLDELERVVRELPFSYYMLAAYTRLSSLDAPRAARALAAGKAAAESDPVKIARRPEFSSPGFLRALELFGVGDVDDGERELDALGIVDPGAAPEVLWAVSMCYARAGSVKLSHALARRALGSSPLKWPVGAWLSAWQLAYPDPYRPIVEREAKQSGVPVPLLYAVMREESAFDADAESTADAYGLMQLIVPTARQAARPLGLPYDRRSLKSPSVNIALGARVLARDMASFPDAPLLGIAAYNAGPGNARRWLRERPHADFDVWIELVSFSETRRYIKRVLASRAAYAYLYEPEAFASAALLPLGLH